MHGLPSALWLDQLLPSVLVGQCQRRGRSSRPDLNMRRVGLPAKGQRRTVLRGGEFYVGPPLGIDQAKQHGFRIGCAVRQDGRRVHFQACPNSSLIVGDLDRAAPEHRCDAIHLDRSRTKVKSQTVHLDLRQEKHQEREIEYRERDQKALNCHDCPPSEANPLMADPCWLPSATVQGPFERVPIANTRVGTLRSAHPPISRSMFLAPCHAMMRSGSNSAIWIAFRAAPF